MDFPLDKMEAVKSLHKLFQRRGIDTPEYRVIETACDRCDGQKFQETLKKRILHRRDLVVAFSCSFLRNPAGFGKIRDPDIPNQ